MKKAARECLLSDDFFKILFSVSCQNSTINIVERIYSKEPPDVRCSNRLPFNSLHYEDESSLITLPRRQ